jgi:glyoxylate reductase
MVDRVIVTRRPPGGAVDRLSAQFDVWVWPHDREIDPAVLEAEVRRADGLYSMLTDRIDRSLLERAERLRVISTMAVGVDNIDLRYCGERGIAVGHTPDVLTDSTADLAWALLMASSRRLAESVDWVRSGSWTRWEPQALLGRDVSGTTLGIVGMGRIGRAIARRASGFDMEILCASRSPVTDPDDLGVVEVALGDLLARSDHVVLCASLTDDTRGLIGRAELAMMKPTANLVNVARGPLVDTDALLDALTRGVIRCAALDVTDPEPLPADHPLVELGNCTIVPHIGSATQRTRVAMADLAVDNLVAGLRGAPMPARIV